MVEEEKGPQQLIKFIHSIAKDGVIHFTINEHRRKNNDNSTDEKTT